ncbi:hypothetical protein L7F22_046456 [Adiantum nelumboides]|nr:hypothetical protein [Adiantum nelumboides]
MDKFMPDVMCAEDIQGMQPVILKFWALPSSSTHQQNEGRAAGSTVHNASTRRRSPSLTTYPLVIKASLMGVLTCADVLFILAILFLATYTFGRQCYLSFKELEIHFKENPSDYDGPLNVIKAGYAAYYMGRSAMIPFSLLWIPVSRGSPFLRLIKMPFEHAVKYHIWLSSLSLFMLVLHGILYIVYYVGTNNAKEIVAWAVEGETYSVLAGVIAAIAGVVMWVTSLSFFRRRWYELFFGIHHLYIVFFVFWLYHVMWTIHFFIIPCLLFVVDRFLRMVQSRQSADVLSAKLLESGSIEIKIAKNNNEGLLYYALSSWYLRFPSLSNLMKLQWHFFSVTSTEMDEKEELSIVVKPLGKWTTLLKEKIIKYTKMGIKTNHCPFTFKAGVEGPYGDESNFFLEYKVLILVGGGIGVTPLLALLRDILHRYRLGGQHLPSTIYLYHCVRKPEELCVLNSIDPNHILPDYQTCGLNIQVFVYVTSTSSSDYNQNTRGFLDTKEVLDLATFEGLPNTKQDHPLREIFFSTSGPTPQSISSISTRGSPMWVAIILVASMTGFYVLWGLSNVFLVKDYEAYFTNYKLC